MSVAHPDIVDIKLALVHPRDSMFYVGLISAIFWAGGTNFLDARWYIVHGISIGDLLFVGWMAWALTTRERGLGFAAAWNTVRHHAALLAAFSFVLLLSVLINSDSYGMTLSDILAILRLQYFCAIIVFVVAFVRRCGIRPILFASLSGIALLAAGRIADLFTSSSAVYAYDIFPVIKDPNVVGSLLGIGMLLTSIAVLLGNVLPALLLASFFAVTSAFTFSKGTWLMVLIGALANAVALLLYYRNRCARGGKKLGRRALVGVLGGILCAASIAYVYHDSVRRLIEFKLASTAEQGTATSRYNFAVAGIYAMLDHPLLGVGFRNYDVTSSLYPDLMPEPSGNAHNAFVQIGAVGGIPALAILLALFFYPFAVLFRCLPARGVLGIGYVVLVALVFLICGCVQLQLTAQPFFWFFSGMVLGLRFSGKTLLPATIV